MEIFLYSLLAVILAFIAMVTVSLILHLLHTGSSKTTLGKEETHFKTLDNGNRIANIPYEEYLNKELPEVFTEVGGLSENKNEAEANSVLIQKAIDEAASKNGGNVVLPKERFHITPIELKSNVSLYIPDGTILVSVDYDRYVSLSKKPGAVIYAKDAENVHLYGGGTIDGNGLTYTFEPEADRPLYALKKFNLYQRVILARKRIRKPKKSEFFRPNVLRFSRCKNSSVTGIRLTDTASWTFVISDCENMTVRDLVIDNHLHIANGDGIDITGGKNITIEHCFIATPDDGLCIKSTDADVSSVKIFNCTVNSFANSFKIGTETEFDITDIKVQNCRFFMPDGIVGGYAGIAIESADGANVSDVEVSDIEMDGVSSALLIWLGDRLRRGRTKAGSMKNITIENVTAEKVELPCAITGCKDAFVDGVTVNGLSFTYRDTDENLCVRKKVKDVSMSDYPEITRVSHHYRHSHETSRYWSLPCCGLFVRNSKNVRINGFFCKMRSVNKLPLFKTENADVKISK